ncbi:MAG: hypothetical protein GX601_07600, partial [Anaerolineales bacterium]|nr:hypothetical protein [Anaerolineales bacterium]
MPSSGKRYHINAYLGNDDLGELRLQALKALASESGCASDGESSMGQWMRYLADLRIQEEGSGYVGVIRDDRDGKRIIFLTKIPETGPDGQLLVETASGVKETWDRAECTGVLGSSAARRLLHAHGVRIPNDVGIVRHVWYLTGGSTEAEAHN